MNTDDRALADLIASPEQEFRKTATIRATQWFKLGDHPAVVLKSARSRYADDGVPWIDTLEGGHIVTPGDWIATGVKGEHWPIKPDIFAASYEPISADRLEAFHAKPVVGKDASNAVKLVRYYKTRGLDDLGSGEIERLYEAAIVLSAALQSPPPVVSDLSPATQRMEKILGAPFVRRSPSVVSAPTPPRREAACQCGIGDQSDIGHYHESWCPALSTPVAAQGDEVREAIRSEIINTPETADFMAGVPIEAAHQRQRWGVSHDAGKSPFDWFWLIGYLSQKAADAQVRGDQDKAKHHTISTAAALANWHLALSDGTDMRPGIGPGNGGDDQFDADFDEILSLVQSVMLRRKEASK